MEFLTIFALALTVIGVALTAFGIWLALRSRNRRRLAWEARKSPVIGRDARLRGELDIRFHGEVVGDPHAVSIELRNTGDVPLRLEDFADPVSIHFEPGAYWLMAAIIADPDERRVSFDKEGGVVTFRPDLLQPAESVYVHGLFDGDPGSAVVSARIAGVKTLDPLRRAPSGAELLGRGILEVLRGITSVSVLGVRIDTRRR